MTMNNVGLLKFSFDLCWLKADEKENIQDTFTKPFLSNTEFIHVCIVISCIGLINLSLLLEYLLPIS